ncbi:MAG: hypothetical protein Q7S34_00570 [bacterium]|nr:hypothetical protein [bacterium]
MALEQLRRPRIGRRGAAKRQVHDGFRVHHEGLHPSQRATARFGGHGWEAARAKRVDLWRVRRMHYPVVRAGGNHSLARVCP